MNERGFTVVEVALAAMIMMIGVVTLLSVIPLSTAAVQIGNQTSTATFLSNQKIEEARSAPWTVTPANDCLGVSASGTAAPTVPGGATCTLGAVTVNAGGALTWLADEGAGAITGFPGYARTVRVANCAVAPGCSGITDGGLRQITVAVTFTPSATSSTAPAAKTVSVSAVVARR